MTESSPWISLSYEMNNFFHPYFCWTEWYESVGGRSIILKSCSDYLTKSQRSYKRFESEVAPNKNFSKIQLKHQKHYRKSDRTWRRHCWDFVKLNRVMFTAEKLFRKICYCLGQRTVERISSVPSHESAIESMRVYHSPRRNYIQLATLYSEFGLRRKWTPYWWSDLLHIPIGVKSRFGELGRHGLYSS